MKSSEKEIWDVLRKVLRGEGNTVEEKQVSNLLENSENIVEDVRIISALNDAELAHRKTQIQRYKKLDQSTATVIPLYNRMLLLGIAAAVILLILSFWGQIFSTQTSQTSPSIANENPRVLSVPDTISPQKNSPEYAQPQSPSPTPNSLPKILPEESQNAPKLLAMLDLDLQQSLEMSQSRYESMHDLIHSLNRTEGEMHSPELLPERVKNWVLNPSQKNLEDIQSYLNTSQKKNLYDSLQAELYLGSNLLFLGQQKSAHQQLTQLFTNIDNQVLLYNVVKKDIYWWYALSLIQEGKTEEAQPILQKLSGKFGEDWRKPANDLLQRLETLSIESE